MDEELEYWKRRYNALLERNLELLAKADLLQAMVDRQASALAEAAWLLDEGDKRVLDAIAERNGA